jgi:hypothetical protein
MPIEAGVQDGADAYAVRGALDEQMERSIAQANAAFLGLVARAAASAPGQDAFGLPPDHAARIAAQAPAARARTADCPYTLFDLRFADAACWSATFHGVAREGPAGSSPALVPADVERFARTAAFLAWHVSRHGALAAALVLGVDPTAYDAWRGLPLQELERATAATAGQLRARWGGHPRFWPLLLDAAADPRPELAERARLLGLQLLATDGCGPAVAVRRPRRPIPGTPAGARPAIRG